VKQFLAVMVAAAGIGFAGYVFLVPYQKMQSALNARTAELNTERTSAQETMAERDKLKASVAEQDALAKSQAALADKHKAGAEALLTQLKPVLEQLGASLSVVDNKLAMTFAADKIIDVNGIDVSEGGAAALKIFAGAVKKRGGTVRVRAKFAGAPPPKALRNLFHNVGEVSAVRAARVMSTLHDAGIPADRLSIVGEQEKAAGGRSKKSTAADRVDLEVETE
jgi:hypothetical protein